MKMFKVLIVGLLMLMIPGVTKCQEAEQVLVDSFLETGADLELLEITDWSVINSKFTSFEEMAELRDKTMEFFGGQEENFHTTKEFDDMYRIMDTEGLTSAGDFLQIIIHSVILPEEYEKEPQTYLVVNVTGQDLSRTAALTENVQKSLKDAGGQSRIATCITGVFNGKLTGNARGEVAQKILNHLKISQTDTYTDEYTWNLVGFSPILPEGIQILGKSYNVNIVMRYNSEDDRTYLWMGTPVVSAEH
jgi:hypothetical protein